MQVPGISPEWFAKQAIMRLDDNMQIEDAIVSGIPSIVAMNAMNNEPAANGADSEDNPDKQGEEGGNKTERPNDGPAPDAPVEKTPEVGY